jgi:DNA polymerase-3 subunit gamma/tau
VPEPIKPVVARPLEKQTAAVGAAPVPSVFSTPPKPSGPAEAITHPAVAPMAVLAKPVSALAVEGSDLGWAERIEALRLEGMTRQFARHCAWLGEAEGIVRLAVDASAKHLMTEERRAAIERALSAGRDGLKVVVGIGNGGDALSPAAADQRGLLDRQRNAEAAIESDPNVRSFKEAFGATVRPNSVQPID